MFYPLLFKPIFKERIWGGCELERLYQKPIPIGKKIGESWELSDINDDVSVILNGVLSGRNLRWLMENYSKEVLGDAISLAGRFPLLCKLLDAHEKLSLQVHPPNTIARSLGGEPKTEIWYVADARPGAELYAGLKSGVSKDEFEAHLKIGQVAECFHVLPVKAGDVLFVPSGRVHGLGSGIVIFEIQQNSDTTYRVFDWNRVGLDGKPRNLHIEQAMKCIDFKDFEPQLTCNPFQALEAGVEERCLVRCPAFTVQQLRLQAGSRFNLKFNRCQVLAVVQGALEVFGTNHSLSLSAGNFCLIPACLGSVSLATNIGVAVLVSEPA